MNANGTTKKRRRILRRRSVTHSVPGQLHDAKVDAPVRLRVIRYDQHAMRDWSIDSLSQLETNSPFAAPDPPRPGKHAHPARTTPSGGTVDGPSRVMWINVDGTQNSNLLKMLGKTFGLHPLALEDVANVHQHAKCEWYGDTVFFVARMPRGNKDEVETEQISIFLQKGLVITIQERPGDCLDSVRQRIEQSLGRIRERDADYLFYAIIDRIVDEYFPLLEYHDERLGAFSHTVMHAAAVDLPIQLHDIRNDFLMIRKIALQYRDAFRHLLNEAETMLSTDTQYFIRDCQDHVNQILEAADVGRETCGELRELHFALIGQKSNDISKVLTIIATIFIPMSFVSGVYGMNFDNSVSPLNMPELRWAYGYPFALTLMALTGGGLLTFLKRRGWLS